MITEKDLISKIEETKNIFTDKLQIGVIHAGTFDPSEQYRDFKGEINRKNINTRDSMRAILESYPYAARILTLCGLYIEFYDNENGEEKYNKIINEATVIIGHVHRFMNENILAKIPLK